MSKVYGLDLDGVCFNFVDAFCEHLFNNTGVNCRPGEITNYYWYECYDELTPEKFWEEFDKFGLAGGYGKLKVIDGVIEGIKRLKDDGKVIAITHRPEYARYDTLITVRSKLGIEDGNTYITTRPKSELINELKIDVYIDDAPHIVDDIIRNTSARVYMIDAKYNKDFEHPDVIRVNSFKEFVDSEVL